MPRYRNLTAQTLTMTFSKHAPIVFEPHGEADVPASLVDLVKSRRYRVTLAGVKTDADLTAERNARLAADMVSAATSKEYADRFLEQIAACQSLADLDGLGRKFFEATEAGLVTRSDADAVAVAGKARARNLNEAQRAALERVTDPTPPVEPAPTTQPGAGVASTSPVDATASTEPAPADPKPDDAADGKSGGHKSTSKPKARG